MKNWIPQKNNLIFAIGFAVLTFVIYIASLFFVIQKNKSVEKIYNSSESESSVREKVFYIKSVVEKNRESLEKIDNFFVKNEVSFIEEVETLARESKIAFEIDSIDIKENKNDQFKEDLLLNLKIEGSWLDIFIFLDSLQKMPFGVSIKNIAFDKKDDEKWSGSVEILVFKEK